MKKCMVAEPGSSSLATVSDHVEAAQRNLALRAAMPDERDFLQRVYENTRTAEFIAAGFDTETIRNLLDRQFAMQDEYYRRHYPKGRFDLVLDGQTRIGRLYHDWHSGEACVIDIALLPAYRGAGIGSRLMKTVVAEAARRAMAVSLYVEMDNPVRALYRTLGFEPVGENGIYERMRRSAAPFDDREFEPVAGLTDGAGE
jgi:ribosomal protein S18 acetylase RimI-like enzyme